MGKQAIQVFDDKNDGFFSISDMGSQWRFQDGQYLSGGGMFASVNQMGMGFPNSSDNSSIKSLYADLCVKYLSFVRVQEEEGTFKKKNGGLKLKLKVKNPMLRRLISGGIAGAVSRTAIALLETIRTHLMVLIVSSFTASVRLVLLKEKKNKPCHLILCIQSNYLVSNTYYYYLTSNLLSSRLFAYDTVNKNLSAKLGEQHKLPIPASSVAGACAGVSSTLVTYPLELVKTRLTIQRDVCNGILDAFLKILREEGPAELYRGLAPSLIGVIPYAATNFYAYDTLRKAYRKVFKQEEIGNNETLLIGSAAGAISSSATFPLEVSREHMQVGALGGRQVYKKCASCTCNHT
ncbi:hypothetical protein GH714_039367 [Hevea brasiliensis]|uniref:Uncharacterized protein n=1 Tax=Hevea brasiliensis TaxID=3981 RepID=A0A6A6KEJ1_HEVBR|nr:hypothetical protein GH714_039367 [Hevea brasiliensis]